MSKARSRVFSSESDIYQSQRIDTLTGQPSTTTKWQYDLVYDYDVLTDVFDPEYKVKVARGDIVIHPFNRYSVRLKSDMGSHSCSKVTNGVLGTNTWSGHMMFRLFASAYGTADVITALDLPTGLQEEINWWMEEHKRWCAANLEKSRYAFGEDVAEIRKTLGSLGGMFNDIRNILMRIPALTQTYVKNGYTLQKALAKVWLRLRYELRPLLISAENLLKISHVGLTQAVGKRQRLKRYHPIRKQYTDTMFTIGSLPNGLHVVNRQQDVEIKTLFGVIFENQDPLLTDLEQLGLGFKDIVPTLWAITRFSFLVDKFINISNLIRGVQNTLDPDIKMLGAWSNIGKSIKVTYTVDYSRSNGYSYSTAPYTTVVEFVDKDRSLSSLSLANALAIDGRIPDFETFADIFAIFVSPKIRGTNFRI